MKRPFLFYDYVVVLILISVVVHFFVDLNSSGLIFIYLMVVLIVTMFEFIIDFHCTREKLSGFEFHKNMVLKVLVLLAINYVILESFFGSGTYKEILKLDMYTEKREPLKPIPPFDKSLETVIYDFNNVIGGLHHRDFEIIKDESLEEGQQLYQFPLCKESEYVMIFDKNYTQVYDDGSKNKDSSMCRSKFKIKLFLKEPKRMFEN